ncbi:pilus assembly protein PilP [bacterium]|nr:pilus assembly protein PilP [bacterium]
MRYLPLLVFLSIFTGCFSEYQSNKASSMQTNLEKERAKIIEEIKKKTEIVREDYIYSVVNKRDPFQDIFMKTGIGTNSLGITESTEKIGVEKISRTYDLQRFEIDELKLTAIIYGTAARRAILVDPTGKSHIVKEGEFLGKNYGKIAAIKADKLIVNEETYDIRKRKQIKNIIVSLNPNEEIE